MNRKNGWIAAFWVIVFSLIPYNINAVNQTAVVKMAGGKAEITFLSGPVTLVSKEGKTLRNLAQGDTLEQGERIRTGKGARIEIRLPDSSFIRFDEETSFELEAVSLDKADRKRDIRVRVILGKAWAKVSRLFSNRGHFSLSTKTAVAGVRGTVYRMNVNQDNSAVVKVYLGEVVVQSKAQAEETTNAFRKLKDAKPAAGAEPGSGPQAISGPRPIPGPRPVSVEEWHQILKSMQQINIRPDGTPSKPFNFSHQEDDNDWVRWNKLRDEKIKSQVEAVGKE